MSLISIVTLSVSLAIVPAAFPQGLDVALLGSESNLASVSDPQTKLLATGRFATVTQVEVRTATPTLSMLQNYDSVITWSNSSYQDSILLGNVLADYVDQGGGVVVMVFADTSFSTNHYLRGRWEAEGYGVLLPTQTSTSSSSSLGTVYAPNHELMAGVNSFSASVAFRAPGISVSPLAQRIADWNDGAPLIIMDESHATPRVDLNFYPPSSDFNSSYWAASTDGANMMANALEWTAGGSIPELTFTSIVPGQYLTFDIRRLSPGNEVVTVLSSRGPGPTPSPFGDILVSLPWFQTPRFPADENGVVNFTTTLPLGVSGHTLYSQAIELLGDGTAELSNPLAVPVP